MRNCRLTEEIIIEAADVDILKNTRSRLRVGSSLAGGHAKAGVDVFREPCSGGTGAYLSRRHQCFRGGNEPESIRAWHG